MSYGFVGQDEAGKEEIAAWETSGERADGIGESDCLLIDLQFLESERHGEILSPCLESRKRLC